MDRKSLALSLALVAVGCGPVIPVDGTGDGSTSFEGPSGEGPNPSVPPNNTPTTPVTTTASPTTPLTTSAPMECAPDEQIPCACPDGTTSDSICSAAGVFGECQCGPGTAVTTDPSDPTWGTSGGSVSTGWSDSSDDWGSSGSSGGGFEPEIPDLPPGETCLPLDMPCVGNFYPDSDNELEDISTCSRVEGDLAIETGVTSLAPLGCLREAQLLVIIGTSLVDLDGLSALEFAEVLAFVENAELASIDIPTLEVVDQLYVLSNVQLTGVELANLSAVNELLEIYDNPQFPDCAIADLLAQTSAPALNCADNLADMCIGVCE